MLSFKVVNCSAVMIIKIAMEIGTGKSDFQTLITKLFTQGTLSSTTQKYSVVNDQCIPQNLRICNSIALILINVGGSFLFQTPYFLRCQQKRCQKGRRWEERDVWTELHNSRQPLCSFTLVRSNTQRFKAPLQVHLGQPLAPLNRGVSPWKGVIAANFWWLYALPVANCETPEGKNITLPLHRLTDSSTLVIIGK